LLLQLGPIEGGQGAKSAVGRNVLKKIKNHLKLTSHARNREESREKKHNKNMIQRIIDKEKINGVYEALF
jgi:hypothetical protein